LIRKIFTSFDKDNSGFISAEELKTVSKELGKEMDTAELEECMKDLDINKDNQISYDEFRKWWLSGRQGLSPWMRRLLAFKLTSSKFIHSISESLQSVIQEAQTEQVEYTTNSFSVNINKVEHAGTTVYAKVLFLSPELNDEDTRIRSLHKF
jgi:hypothetical protein